MSEKCGACMYLTLPIRGLQKYPRCLFKQDPSNCKGPFLPTPARLDRFGKALKAACDKVNAELGSQRGEVSSHE